ncbi:MULTISPECIES: outer membrane protein assembly factor BamA [unclassified Chryseobacterium]|uniref:outer membrane protein assembly factor BamA n=1 Tax=unclassified Chryseobacterium TaxID=2593645 RepID=UPI0006471D0F|nr:MULTISPECIES: outer membrane protein assembly factor BamA [unclassified Chryseobacterium]SHG75938.1 Beta-barrel assembly machine subunit BamA [Chryseobacterium sp. OV279]HCA09197.1 outer membrane protein assembly factor BamA [Chryseobacterium sp.]
MKFRLLPIIMFAASAHFYGQVTPQDSTKVNNAVHAENGTGTYTLKDIVVDGVKKYTPAQILRFTGLTKGEVVDIPGQKISNAVKKLWDTQSFSEVEVYVQSIEGETIILRFYLQDLKELGEVKFAGKGIGKSKNEKLIKDNNLKPGTKITQNLISGLKTKVPKDYVKKGFADAKITIQDKVNANDPSMVDWTINVDKGKRIKIDHIEFEGNQSVTDAKLRNKAFKETKQRRFSIGGILKSSKFIEEKYQEDKQSLVSYYNSLGYRDATIVSDSVWRNKRNNYEINVKLKEGKKYYIGDITFTGNTVYATEHLQRLLGYKKGDIYDAVGFNKKVGEDGGKEDDSDIKSVYMNNGYLFSSVTPVEKSVSGDAVNLEIRITEGEQATWNKVTWQGNTTTHDHVVLRALRTKPGELFKKTEIKRTYFDLAGMTFFDPQQVGQDIQPNQQDNTVDINWKLVEKGSSQVQLQAGYGGNSFIGTLGLTFNNFSLKNFLKFKDFKPVPQGDGQTLSIQAQAGQYFQNYGVSFTEPWLFGTKPTALSVSLNTSRVKYSDATGSAQKLNIFSASVGLNRLLNWPDDYFSLYTGIQFQNYKFSNYPFQFGDTTEYYGDANNLSLNLGLSRNSAGLDPIFPTMGSNIELSAKMTAPYSLFSNKDYSTMSPVDKYKWMEFYKIKFKADIYNEIAGKLVLRSSAEMGFMDGYNKKLGAPPFERFYVGGTGLFGGRYDGRELIPLRGYENASTYGGEPDDITPKGGGTIYNRFTLELRYPISMNQTAKIYALTFAEGGNVWNSWGTYNPFELKRSVGIGVRVYMGAFGLIGFDFAYGFDKTISGQKQSKMIPHFLMNQSL